jgi:hypothetical protein
MTSDGSGITLGCTTCGVELHLAPQDEAELREALASFFAQHDTCHVFLDLSRSGVPLPRPAAG